jgi:flagellar motor switch/type III secretory pathway protein FliN
MAAANIRSGLWQASEAARELRWLRPARLERLRHALQQAVGGWSAAWDLQSPPGDIHCAAFSGSGPQAGWTALEAKGNAVAWIHLPADAVLLAMFPGAEALGSLVRQLAELARLDAIRRLALALKLELRPEAGEAPSAAEARPLSGALEASFDGLACRLVLGSAAAASWLDAAAPHAGRTASTSASLSPACDAVSRRPFALHAQLSGCELPLGELQALQVGDVLRLQHPLADPAAMTDEAGTPLFAGHLAQRDGAVAVELAKLH